MNSQLQNTIHYGQVSPPGPREWLAESRAILSLAKLARGWSSLKVAPAKSPKTLLVLPGYMGAEGSTRMIVSVLRKAGHQAHDWGLGRNHGNLKKLIPKIQSRIDQLTQASDTSVVLVGWSLGGVIAREIARQSPLQIERVITLGSPVIGGPKYTITAGIYKHTGQDLEKIEREVADRFSTPITRPIVSLYSRLDGVVAWEACIDRWSPDVRHIQVNCAHLGMGFDPEVLALLPNLVEGLV